MGDGPVIVRTKPTTYTEEVGDMICARIAEGDLLTAMCREEGMPAVRTVTGWLMDSRAGGQVPASFQENYTKAREQSAYVREDEITEISDDGRNDWMDRVINGDGDTVRVVDHEHIQRSKLRVDSRRWLLSHLQPGKYGDRVAHQMLGKDGKPSEPRCIVIVDGAPGSEDVK